MQISCFWTTKVRFLFEYAKPYELQLEIINIKKKAFKVGLSFLFVIL